MPAKMTQLEYVKSLNPNAPIPHCVMTCGKLAEVLQSRADLQAEVINLNEGAKLLHSLATGMYDVDTDEGNLLKQWQNEPDFEDEKKEVQPIIDFDNVQEIPL